MVNVLNGTDGEVEENSIDRNEKRTGPRVLYHLIYVLLSFHMVVGSMDVYQTMQALIKYAEKRVLVMRKLVSTVSFMKMKFESQHSLKKLEAGIWRPRYFGSELSPKTVPGSAS